MSENIRLCEEADIQLSADELSAIGKVAAILKSSDGIPCTECHRCSCSHRAFAACCFLMYNSAKESDLAKIPASEHKCGPVCKNTPQEAARRNDCRLCRWQRGKGSTFHATEKSRPPFGKGQSWLLTN